MPRSSSTWSATSPRRAKAEPGIFHNTYFQATSDYEHALNVARQSSESEQGSYALLGLLSQRARNAASNFWSRQMKDAVVPHLLEAIGFLGGRDSSTFSDRSPRTFSTSERRRCAVGSVSVERASCEGRHCGSASSLPDVPSTDEESEGSTPSVLGTATS
jgi:hypothetical protein